MHTNYSFQKKSEAGVDWENQGRPEQSGAIHSQHPAVVYFSVPETPFLLPSVSFYVLDGWLVVEDVGEGKEKYVWEEGE